MTGVQTCALPIYRWRETFAEKLRGHGVEAEATRQATRGRTRNYDPLWRVKTREDGRLRTGRSSAKTSAQARSTRAEAVQAWMQLSRALETSADDADRKLAHAIASFVREMGDAPGINNQGRAHGGAEPRVVRSEPGR